MKDQEELAAIEGLVRDLQSRDGILLVSDESLMSTQRRERLGTYISSMWRYRHFTYEYSRYKAKADNDDMFLGKLWTLLEPLLRIGMYGVIFGMILNTSRGIENFVGFLIIGVMFFSQMSRGLGGGSGIIQRSRAMMRTFRFPRASLVVGEALRSFFASLIPLSLSVLAALLFQLNQPISWTLVLVVPLVLLMSVFALGIMFFTARITAFLPDAKKIVFFVNRAWFYVSGVFFSVERFARVPELQTVMVANPAYRFLSAVRGAVMYAEAPSVKDWGILLAWAGGTLLLGFFYFWRAEDRYVHVR